MAIVAMLKRLLGRSCGGLGLLLLVAFLGPETASAQVTKTKGDFVKPCAKGDYQSFDCRPSEDSETQVDTERRIASYTPNPIKYPIPRTPWDGKPDLSGVFWPAVTLKDPSELALESVCGRIEILENMLETDCMAERGEFELKVRFCFAKSPEKR